VTSIHSAADQARACETGRKRHTAARAALLVALLALGRPAAAAIQPEPSPVVGGATHKAAGEIEEHGGGGLVGTIARLVNFAVLAGTLVYFLRSPIRAYLVDRSAQIRRDLVEAAEMRRAAAAQIQEIDRRMAALPGELETLRAQGAEEIAAEEARIRTAAAAERDRLLEQARREIDARVKVAERELVSRAADLAVGVAAERIRKNITDEDQQRLVDRYVQQLKGQG
jgi:F-type H+-transporting ATPase subunit b